MSYRVSWVFEYVILSLAGIAVLTASAPRPANEVDRVRAYTRNIEFDYVSWMLNAAGLKLEQGAIGIPGYMKPESDKTAVSDYLQLTRQIIEAEDALNKIYADPSITEKQAASAHIRSQLDALDARQGALAPIAEGVLQGQVATVAADQGLTALGQPIPSVLYHSTSVPDALIVSPRNHIEQSANISITPGLTADQQTELEDRVDSGLDVSSLVVPIGGVGVYPTMIMRTTDLNWLTSTIAHEWTHNFLEFRPLGLLYDHTPELRTMNETTADIVGGEIGAEILHRYYPDLHSSEPPSLNLIAFPSDHPNPGDVRRPAFDFRAEMHTTRVTVDALLAEGKIDQAESYMEHRRQLFVQNGDYIRRLNQAYFAFYGAYADVPGGAAGEDPVGPAVRALRAQSKSLSDFLNRISWMTSFDQLKQAVRQ
ncbi:MAG TPA: hypothetical protein VMJ64_04300 [Anaerolineales bacterium]|nr:hypothetical protein [Anaerolineales bacterium]